MYIPLTEGSPVSLTSLRTLANSWEERHCFSHARILRLKEENARARARARVVWGPT